MLSAFQAAVTAGSPGIATTVVSATSFIAPINSALAGGHPGDHVQRERFHR